ncbi:ester cyclase [Methylobacterium sp. J-026]|uniref:ester cyclase n=1 Tax=Methylobacterium sp. J-026 TaxID=2836624 RepID=UPI001FBBD482|nr:ester cyclase [Methylobacterium sp. J-026]MCJ2135115.1 ester cyclase [Methylobacterium sp. J-026]
MPIAPSTPAHAAQVDDRAAVALAKSQELIVDESLPAATVSAMLTPVDAFYGFWNSGSQTLLDQALGPNFTDHTPPPGRPPGPSGPATAGKAFLAAVPDLKVTVVQQLVVGDRVVSHLRFAGRFTGRFSGVEGKGQAIDFIATDILRVAGGRITDNWHLEDNLTFLRQAGLLPAASD